MHTQLVPTLRRHRYDDTQVLLALPFLSNPIIVNTLIFEIGDG
jgi:hypothetical protein